MARWRGTCKRCKKRNYVDEIAAKLTIANANAERNGNNQEVLPKRAYKCPTSRYYHLTSKEDRYKNVG